MKSSGWKKECLFYVFFMDVELMIFMIIVLGIISIFFLIGELMG